METIIESLLLVSSDLSPTQHRRGGMRISLPPHYAITVTADGSCFPMWYASLASEHSGQDSNTSTNADHTPSLLCHLHWEDQRIPSPYDDSNSPLRKGQSGVIRCSSVKEAQEWCWREHEHAVLQIVWERLAQTTALYPERVGWYLEEIEQLLEKREHGLATHSNAVMRHTHVGEWQIRIDGLGTQVSARLTAWTQQNGWEEVVEVNAETVDEVWEALYQEVWQWLQTLRNDESDSQHDDRNALCQEVTTHE
jgi:hypothetical protein